jgi:putative hemolysin
MTTDKKFIDVAKLIQEKSPKAYRWMPGFIIRWIKKTIHEDEVNYAISHSVGLDDIAFADYCMDYFKADVTHTGLEHVPKTGPVVLVSNHPLGGLDGIAFMSTVGKLRPDIRFVVNDLLTHIPNFKKVVVGINKVGAKSRASLDLIEATFAADFAVLLFPAGLCSRKMDDGTIRDLTWQKGFITRAIRYNLPVVPVHIDGKNSNWFYNLARFRKKIGLKLNIEMFYLSDEMFGQRGKKIHVTFGQPIPPSTWSDDRKPDEWSELMRQFVYELAQNPDAIFSPKPSVNS